MNETPRKKTILFCTCSGACPSMAKIDFWTLAERIRLELGDKIEFMALHPRLCEEDDELMMGRVVKEDLCFVTAACLSKRQEKLLKAGFEKAGVPMDKELFRHEGFFSKEDIVAKWKEFEVELPAGTPL